jgi:hypothetical protein
MQNYKPRSRSVDSCLVGIVLGCILGSVTFVYAVNMPNAYEFWNSHRRRELERLQQPHKRCDLPHNAGSRQPRSFQRMADDYIPGNMPPTWYRILFHYMYNTQSLLTFLSCLQSWREWNLWRRNRTWSWRICRRPGGRDSYRRKFHHTRCCKPSYYKVYRDRVICFVNYGTNYLRGQEDHRHRYASTV